MTRLDTILGLWPLPVAATLCGAMVFTTAMDKIDLPDWLLDHFAQVPEAPTPDLPEERPPAPQTSFSVPYAPAPGRDDRTPLVYVPHVFGFEDRDFTGQLSGTAPVFWDHGGQATGALIARDLVLSTAHVFVDTGKWEGPYGLTSNPPAPSDGRIYLEACGQAYAFKAIHPGSMSPRARLGLDYAIVELAQPACEAAQILPVAETPDDLIEAQDQILLSIGAYRYADLPSYAQHPLYAARTTSDKFARYDVFGVRCEATAREDTGDVAGDSTATIAATGCDAVPGGSGGPLIVSRDGGASFAIVGVTNSYRKGTEYNNYTRIEGAFAKHLSAFLPLTRLPEASSATPITRPALPKGDWHPITFSTDKLEDMK
ncbi:MAG: trypsin-like serine peptidase [Pelagimonas sp.]|uniref:trypsin-like serine peptidase n=1 Tax=Pelagimonas sp. TaxID=2073170 RepID=UPI003D6BC00B